LNDLPESQRALRTEMNLAHSFHAEVTTVSVLEIFPLTLPIAIAANLTAPDLIRGDRREMQMNLHEKATRLVGEHGVQDTRAVS
jgi:hypothetical protein